MHLNFLSALALLASTPNAEPADTPSIDEQLQCVLQGYSADDQRDLDAWVKAYEYGRTQEKPVNLVVSLARAKQCKELLSWTSSQETMASFYATFVLEERASNAVMPIAKKNVTAFYDSLDEKEAKSMESALLTMASGIINAVDDDEEPDLMVLLASYAVNEKVSEKFPNIGEKEKSGLTHLLLMGTFKDVSRQLFVKETSKETPVGVGEEVMPLAPASGAPSSEPPPERPDQIQPSPNN
ncbi:MAG: hypothetical protein ABJP34_07880 [Erythrobacter sp.]